MFVRKLKLLALLGLCFWGSAASAQAAELTLHIYGSGGSAPAMKEAAQVFGEQHHIQVLVTAGSLSNWKAAAEYDGDVVYSG